MEKLETISKNIKAKRNEKLDSQALSIKKLQLSKYDIRKNRNTDKMKEDLLRDGQLQPITVSKSGDEYTVVNGRTRYLGMVVHPDKFPTVIVEVYENLTTLEQNYLNAQINVGQNPLTPDEKREFIIKHRKDLPIKDMAKALGLGLEMFKNYMATADVSKAVLKAWTPQSEGHGRGSVKVEELGKVVRAYEQESGKKPDNKTLKKLGELSEASDLKRDEKRIAFPKVVKKVAQLQKNEDVVKEYDTETIIQCASQTVLNINKSSGDKLPENSSKKFKIVDGLLKDKFDFAVLLFAEALYRDDDGNKIASETKRVIDAVDEIIVVGIELDKLTDIKKYADSLGKKITIHKMDVLAACDTVLKTDKRKGFVYVNGAALFSQRPQFMNYLKDLYPNSRIAMIFLDLLFGKKQTNNGVTLRERFTVYGGAENFDEIIAKFKSLVKFSKFKKYSDAPNEKYIVHV